MEVPSPSDPAALLWAIIQEREVLVGLGHRGAEALFVWEPPEQDAVIDETLNFVDDVTTAEVVGAQERHRFLWRTWESGFQFRRAADVIEDPKVVRILAWPNTIDQRRAAAT
jgi:hypothetical protein